MLTGLHFRHVRRAIPVHLTAVITILLIIAPTCRLSAQELAFDRNHMPDGWSIEREILVPEAELPQFEAKLGAKLAEIRNQFLNVRGAHRDGPRNSDSMLRWLPPFN